MGAKFRKVDPRIWDDEDFEKLDRDGKLLAFWILTSNQINRCGICLWRSSLAAEQTGIPDADTVCHTVCDTLNWVRCSRSRCILLPRFWRYNQPDNEKALKGALSDLHDLPQNDLSAGFRKTKGLLKPSLHETFDRVCDTVWDTVLRSSSSSSSNSRRSMGGGKTAPASTHPDPDLVSWCQWWNGLHVDGLVAAGIANPENPSDGVKAGWRRVKRSKPLRELLAQQWSLRIEIQQASICRQGWFRLEVLFGGKNKTGELIVQKLLDGGYRDDRKEPEFTGRLR